MQTSFIIDPKVFYWISVMGILKTVTGVIGGILLTTSFGCAIAWIYYHESAKTYEGDEQWRKLLKKWTLIALSIGVPLVIASIFIPGKSTSVEMLIARTVTVENVNWSVSQVKEIVDYIVKAIQSI